MPFDALAMAAVADEVRAAVIGGRIQRIIQPSQTAVALSIYARGEQRHVLLSADATFARAQLVLERPAGAFSTPSPFTMLLRKYLDGAWTQDVAETPGERVLTLTCTSGGQRYRLVTEVMGRHSNVILVDAAERVLGAVKLVPPARSRARPILPGRPFEPAPQQPRNPELYPEGPRLDPCRQPARCLTLLRGVTGDAPLSTALLGLLAGASPFLTEQIALGAGYAPATPVAEAALERVVESGQRLYELYRSRAWSPTRFVNAREMPDFAPYLPLDVSQPQPAPSVSGAIDWWVGDREARDSLAATRRQVRETLERALRTVDRRLDSLRQGLEAADAAAGVMEQGQLLLAYSSMIPPKAEAFEVPDLGLTIPLDPKLSAAENAERLFRRYRKLRDAQHKLPELIGEAERERGRLEDIAAFVPLANSEADLRELERQVSPPSAEPKKKPKREKRRSHLRLSLDGYTALVGRSARENEELTFQVARRGDLWLHARERTGAHVVLQTARQGGELPAESLVRSAAQLAAYFSEGRADGAVDVDVTEARNVRKIPGGPPGRVTYRNFQTIRVAPSRAGWTESRGKE